MIARVIAWLAPHRLLVLFGTGLAALGFYALVHLSLDVIPELSDTQVIIYTEYPDQPAQAIDGQMTATPESVKLQVAHGFSLFGVSFIHVTSGHGTPQAVTASDEKDMGERK